MKLQHLLIVIFCSISLSFFAQTVGFQVKTVNYTTTKKEPGVTVKVYDGSTVVNTGQTSGGGEYAFSVPAGKTYKVEVSKAGMVTRFVMLNVTNVNDELIQGTGNVKGQVELKMVSEIPNVDFSYVSQNPTTTFTYDGKNPELQFDQAAGMKMLKEIEKIMKQGADADKQKEADYNAAMKAAAALEAQKKYAEAIKEYEKAAYFKPLDKAAPAKIVELEGILKAQTNAQNATAQLDQDYQNLITAGNTLRDQGKHQDAIAKYQEALTKKQEQYPKDEIVKCQKAIADAKTAAENKAKYDAAMTAANSFFTQKSWQAAKDKYKEALKYAPNDPTATAKLAEIDGKLNAQKAEQEIKANYQKFVDEGDKLMTELKYAEAKVQYQEALKIMSGSQYPADKIKECDTKIAEIAAAKTKQDQIAKLLDEGNTAFNSKQWAPSKAKYQEVIKLDAANAVAAARITEIDAKIAEDAKNAAAIAEAKKLVTEGDALAKTGKNEDALAKYNAAQAKYNDPTVQPKIDAVNAAILAAKDKEAKKAAFDKAIADGDAALAAKNYEGAKAKYNEAQVMDAASTVPKAKLAEVDKQIAAAGAAEKKAAFDKAISEGDAALVANNFEEAKAKYNAAQTIDAGSTVPKTKLAEVEKKISANQAAADKAAKYTAEITKGDAAMASKDYTAAKTAYAAAIALDPKEEAKAKLAQAEKALADNAAIEQQKQKYEAAVKAGNDLFTAGKLAEAKVKFVEANKIDATQSLPVDKIKEIDATLASEAKKAEVAKLMSEGNTNLTAKKFTDAKAKYQQVLTIDAGNTEAKSKLAEAIQGENNAIGEAERKAKFQTLKTEGIALMGQGKYLEAKTKLTEAKAIQADAEVDKKITECDAKLAEIAKGAEAGQKYTDAMAQAKALEAANKLDDAIAKYNEALTYKNEQEPKDRIAAINQLKQGQANTAKLEEEFNALVKAGDAAFSSKEYIAAIAKYSEALSKKNDAVVAAKKAEAEKLNAAISLNEEEEQYQKILSAGQKGIDEKNYTRAKEMYNRALGIRSNDPIPKQKLAEIEALLKVEGDAKAKDAAYAAKVAEAENNAKAGKIEAAIASFEQAKGIKPTETLPDTRIAELKMQLANTPNPQAEAEKKYQDAMNAGNALATSKDYNSAIAKYQEALAVKPKDNAATSKIAEMRQILDDLAKADKNKAEIDALLKIADGLFNTNNWSDAKKKYDEVLTKQPSNTYAKTQSDLCVKKLEEEKFTEVEKEYRKLITVADKNFDQTDYNKAKDYYKRAVNVRPSDPYPKKRLAEIEELLNPKPKNTTPLLTQTGPDPLPALGELSSATDDEDSKRLEDAQNKRHQRNPRRMKALVDSTRMKNEGFSTTQLERTTEADQKFTEIKIQADQVADSADENHNENFAVIHSEDEKMILNAQERDDQKTSDREYIKSQLTVYTDEHEKASAILDNSAVENAKVFDGTQNDIVEKTDVIATDDYHADIHSNQTLTDIKIGVDKKNIDDFESRKATEDIVREASEKEVAVTESNIEKKAGEITETQGVLTDVTQKVEDQQHEDIKQAPINHEEIKKIDANQQAFVDAEGKEHMENSFTYKEILVQEEQVVIKKQEEDSKRNLENVDELVEVQVNKEEQDRVGYNQVYEKSLSNKNILTAEVVKQDAYAELPSLAVEENVKVYNDVRTGEQERAIAAGNAQDEKHLNNQGILTNSSVTSDEKSLKDSEKPGNNAEIIKRTQEGVGTVDKAQVDQQMEKTMASKATLTAIETKEPEVVDKPANDLGKLYPEGVSQEKFDQKGEDGLITAIVTRRIVIKAGHGDVYLRTQTTSTTTYSKNGAPTTEAVWLKETQDARLQKNY